jgi:hypothetical protein
MLSTSVDPHFRRHMIHALEMTEGYQFGCVHPMGERTINAMATACENGPLFC